MKLRLIATVLAANLAAAILQSDYVGFVHCLWLLLQPSARGGETWTPSFEAKGARFPAAPVTQRVDELRLADGPGPRRCARAAGPDEPQRVDRQSETVLHERDGL
jgi:hypothetical protein